MDVEQRLDDRLDAAPAERLGQRDGLGARPGHQCTPADAVTASCSWTFIAQPPSR